MCGMSVSPEGEGWQTQEEAAPLFGPDIHMLNITVHNIHANW